MKNKCLILIFVTLFSCKSENTNDNLIQLDKAIDLSLETVMETLDKPAYYYRITKENVTQINEIVNLSDSLLRMIDNSSLNENSFIEMKKTFISLTPNAKIKESISEILKVPFSSENLLLEKIKIKQSLFLFLNAYQDSIESRSIDIYDFKNIVLTEKTKFGNKIGFNIKVVPVAESATIFIGEFDSTMTETGEFDYVMCQGFDSVEVVNGIGQFGFVMNEKQKEIKGLVRFYNFKGERVSKPFKKKLKY